MRATLFSISTATLIILGANSEARAQNTWTPEQETLLDSIERLSTSTGPDGGGPDAYRAVLADDYSRWTLGGAVINDRESWIQGMREWWEDGWRVVDREAEVSEIAVHGDIAFARRIVAETYRGPDGETTHSKAALAEVWRRDGEAWELVRVDIHVLPDE